MLITDEYGEELNGRDEETGFRAASWRYLCSTQAFTMVRYPLHYFLATGLSLAPLDHGEHGGEGEDIDVCWFNLDEAERMALDGRIGEDLGALQILRLAHAERASRATGCSSSRPCKRATTGAN